VPASPLLRVALLASGALLGLLRLLSAGGQHEEAPAGSTRRRRARGAGGGRASVRATSRICEADDGETAAERTI
jgi:hypothetical protein